MSASFPIKTKLPSKDKASVMKMMKSNLLGNDLQQLKSDLYNVIQDYEPKVKTVYQDTVKTSKSSKDEDRIHSPVIIVALESSNKPIVKAIHWKHFPLNGGSLSIVVNFCEKFCMLKSMRLEDSDLKEPDVLVLVNFLRSNPNVTDLNLNGNKYKDNFHKLLEDTKLKYLSLKFCGISKKELAKLLKPLKVAYENPLIYLNLANNDVDDEGSIELADMLRVNRILIAMNLSCNKITDEGARIILQCSKSFNLKLEEISLRRKIYYSYYMKKYEQFQLASKSNTMPEEIPEEANKEPSFLSGKDAREKGSAKGKKRLRRISKSIVSSSEILMRNLSVTKDVNSAPTAPVDFLSPENVDGSELSSVSDWQSSNHPFIKDIVVDGVDFICRGNFNLKYLNLAYNRLSSDIVRILHDILEYQNSNGTTSEGLQKFIIVGNNVKPDKFEDIQMEIEKFLAEKIDKITPSITHIPKDITKKEKRRSSKS